MKTPVNILSLLTAILLASGCVTGNRRHVRGTSYRYVPLHDVHTVDTKSGREIRLKAEKFIAFSEVIERSPNVKSVTRMTDLKGEREPFFFTVSPDGKYLVYQATEKAQGIRFINLWRISTHGGAEKTRLTRGRYVDIQPAFNPDGTAVCFASNRSSTELKLCRVLMDGAGGITRITHADSVDLAPSCTPDGKNIFYSSKPFNAIDWQMWRIGVNGNLPTQMKEGYWPKISPDGHKVLYCDRDNESGRWKIWVMNSDGTNQTQLTSDNKSDEFHASWSPDGKHIVYASNAGRDSNGKRNHDIWIMRADGANPTQLTTNGSTEFWPVFSPDGRFVYFLSNRGFYYDIWRAEIIDRL